MDITRKEYENNYDDRLSSYKSDYEDKSEKSFLEVELNIYAKYYNSLKKISHFIKTSPKNNLGQYPITSEVGWELEIINKQVYNEIITIKKSRQEEDEFERLLNPVGRAPSIEINIDNLNNRILSAKSILEFINDRKMNIKKPDIRESKTDFGINNSSVNFEKKVNPHPQVFSDSKAFELFEKLHETYKATKYPIADYSFIYRMMFDDGYILESFRPQMFINWISKEPYNIELDKIKTISSCKTDSKIQTYNSIKK